MIDVARKLAGLIVGEQMITTQGLGTRDEVNNQSAHHEAIVRPIRLRWQKVDKPSVFHFDQGAQRKQAPYITGFDPMDRSRLHGQPYLSEHEGTAQGRQPVPFAIPVRQILAAEGLFIEIPWCRVIESASKVGHACGPSRSRRAARISVYRQATAQ